MGKQGWVLCSLPGPRRGGWPQNWTDYQTQQVLQQSRKLSPAPLGEMLDIGLPSSIKESFQEVEQLSFCLHQPSLAAFAVQAPPAFQSADGELAKAS